jgi:hypothetical protein
MLGGSPFAAGYSLDDKDGNISTLFHSYPQISIVQRESFSFSFAMDGLSLLTT